MTDPIENAFAGVEQVVDPVRNTRIATKVGVTFLSVMLLAGLIGLVLRVTGAAFVNTGAQGEEAVADEDWLVRKAAEIHAMDREIAAADEAFARKKALADERWISREDDRAELDRLSQLVLSLKTKRAAIVKEYDVMAASTQGTAAVWSEQ